MLCLECAAFRRQGELSSSGRWDALKHVLGLSIGVVAILVIVKSFRAERMPETPFIPQKYMQFGNCTGTRSHGAKTGNQLRDRGEYLVGMGVHELDNHPLSAPFGFHDRLRVLGWVYSPIPECLVEKIFATVRSPKMELIIIHTSLDSDHFSILLNLLLSLQRSHVDLSEILVVVYDYEPIPEDISTVLQMARIQYISVWEFDVPSTLFVEPQLTAPQFFYVRNVIHLKLLKIGYHILHMDSDLVVLQGHPFKGLDPARYSIEAAPGASPLAQRKKWGHTLNCGYMSITSTPLTIQFVEKLLAYNFDSSNPIDQWALNELLDLAGAKFESRRVSTGEIVSLRKDKGPIPGYVDMNQARLQVRILDPQEYIAGRWLNQYNMTKLTFQSFVDTLKLNPKSVHITNVQSGVAYKIESLRQKGLWFLHNDWVALASSGLMQSLSSLDNGTPALGRSLSL